MMRHEVVKLGVYGVCSVVIQAFAPAHAAAQTCWASKNGLASYCEKADRVACGLTEEWHQTEMPDCTSPAITVQISERSSSQPSDPAVKYSGTVLVYRRGADGTWGKLGEYKGSTLPNPYWVYKDTATGKPIDIDGRLHQVFENLDGLNLDALGLGGLRPLVSMFREDSKYPIVASGSYPFSVEDSGKSSRSPRALLLANGGQIPTINSNPNQQGRYFATEIFLHRGRSDGINRDSEGCLTIDPGQWATFIAHFPTQAEWYRQGFRGTLVIERDNSDTSPLSRPSAPTNVRIIR